jgi:hypothetical protein
MPTLFLVMVVVGAALTALVASVGNRAQARRPDSLGHGTCAAHGCLHVVRPARQDQRPGYHRRRQYAALGHLCPVCRSLVPIPAAAAAAPAHLVAGGPGRGFLLPSAGGARTSPRTRPGGICRSMLAGVVRTAAETQGNHRARPVLCRYRLHPRDRGARRAPGWTRDRQCRNAGADGIEPGAGPELSDLDRLSRHPFSWARGDDQGAVRRAQPGAGDAGRTDRPHQPALHPRHPGAATGHVPAQRPVPCLC